VLFLHVEERNAEKGKQRKNMIKDKRPEGKKNNKYI
jgi:hypothetical protein